MFLETHGQSKAYPAHEEVDAEQLDANNSLTVMAALVGEGKRVLDMGCAGGYFAKLLSRRACEVVGIDVNPSAAEEASRFCVSAYTADIDRATLREILPEGSRFDVVVFGDVLEHLREPMRLLEEARLFLAEGGYVVASIPNVAHGAIRLSLFAGAFNYQKIGILDDTHLRFFTVKTIEEMFVIAGFRLERVERTKLPVFEPSDLLPRIDRGDFLDSVADEVLADPESDVLQFIVRAQPLAEEARLRLVVERFLEVNAQFEESRRRLARRDADLISERARADEIARELERTRVHLHLADTEMRKAQAANAATVEELRKAIGCLGEAERRGIVLEIEHGTLLARVERLVDERDRLLIKIHAEENHAKELRLRAEASDRLVDEHTAALERRESELTKALEDRANELRVHAESSERLIAEYTAALERRESELAKALEDRANELRVHAEASDRLVAEHAAALERRDGELAKALSEIETLRARAKHAERLLLDQVESATADSQAESARLALLIDTVQSSWFWRLKRRLARILGRPVVATT